jgi:hypothetical protein
MDTSDRRAKLIEDLGSPEAADELLPVVDALGAWPVPAPSPIDTARLIARLRSELPRTSPRSARLRSALHSNWAWLIVRSQLRVVRTEIWAASALVMIVGAGVTLLMAYLRNPETLPFVLVAPVVAAVGTAFIYGPGSDPTMEIEWTTPTSPRLLLLARLMLVFGFDLILGLLGSAALALLPTHLAFWPLVSAWLAPMAFLSALAFLLAVLTSEPALGTLAGLGLWGLLNAIRLARLNHYPIFEQWPNLLAADAQPWLWTLAGVMGLLALWLGGRAEHWLRKQQA